MFCNLSWFLGRKGKQKSSYGLDLNQNTFLSLFSISHHHANFINHKQTASSPGLPLLLSESLTMRLIYTITHHIHQPYYHPHSPYCLRQLLVNVIFKYLFSVCVCICAVLCMWCACHSIGRISCGFLGAFFVYLNRQVVLVMRRQTALTRFLTRQ